MPLGELVGEGLGFLLRVVLQVVGEVLIEIPVRATGYAVLRLCGRRPDFDGSAVVLAGLLCGAAVIGGVVCCLAMRGG